MNSGAIHQQPTKAVLGQGSIPVFTIYFPLQDTVSSTIPQETSDKVLNRIKNEKREKFLAGLKSSSQNFSEHKPKFKKKQAIILLRIITKNQTVNCCPSSSFSLHAKTLARFFSLK